MPTICPNLAPSALWSKELIHDSSLGATVGMYRVVNRYRNLLRRFLNVEGISFQWIVQLAAGC
jgi:hypothetical protein